ncbi:MAG TPA: DNA polymerase III subunit gamma/tau [Candidatus Limnocylindria bacterium]|nr:DNA polymerase III subunit gamma/tau [Candidatus Limnocylindria bacterium]
MAVDQTPSTPHQALYRRWRSQTFKDVVAQDAIVETLRNAVRLNRLAHGLLFVGPRGTGKTSTARIVAKAVNCLNVADGEPDDTCESCVAIREGRALDVVELDAASNNRVDDMRELVPRVYTAPADLRRKVFIIDEVQRIKEGWDVLLKTLEEPPPDVLFIFCTTDPSGIRPAVVSRLQRYTFRPLPEKQISGKLRRIAQAEGRTITDDAMELIAQRAAGGMRDAESMLDQVISSGVDAINADTVRDLLGLAEMESVDRFIDDLASGEALDGIRLLDDLEGDGRDLVAFADQVVARLREQLVSALGNNRLGADRAQRLTRAARRLAGLDVNRGAAGGYRLQLELALLEGGDGTTSDSPIRTAQQPAAHAVAQPAPARPEPAQAKPAPVQSASPSTEPPPAKSKPAPQAVKVEVEDRPVQSVPSSPAPSAPVDDALAELLAAWPQVVERISRNPADRPLISACRPVEVSGATIVLGFPESQAFMRDIATRKQRKLEEGIGEVLGRAVAVRCVATNIELIQQELTAASGSEDLVTQARKIFADDLVDVAEVD